MTSWRVQGLRFGAVGIASNLVLYLAYLALTSQGVGHKLAMSLLYVVGVLQTFVVNRRWSFAHAGHAGSALSKYAAIYGLGYLLNLGVLAVAVDAWGLAHEWVQGAMIVLLAVLLFLLQRYWVFAPTPRERRAVP